MERPKPKKIAELDDDDDELLKLQQQFLASNSKPSASTLTVKTREKRKSAAETTARDVVHMDTLPAAPPSMDAQPPKKSRFRADRERTQPPQPGQTTPVPTAKDHGPALDPEAMIDRQDTGLATILSSIIERDTRNAVFTAPQQSCRAFPPVVKSSNVSKGGKRGQSLFSQQVMERGVEDFGLSAASGVERDSSKMDTDNPATPTSQPPASGVHQGPLMSHVVDGRGLSASRAAEEAESIHRDNLNTLAGMSQEDIVAEQQRLLQMMDPSMVQFLRSKAASEKLSGEQSRIRPSAKATQPPKKAQSTPAADVADVAARTLGEDEGRWLHMDNVEHDKLQWMTDLPPPSADHPKTGQQARFDFQGQIIPADADVPVHVGLHHHGEEPERAGYSVGELFQLARSTNVQQRVLALNTLGNIVHKAKAGLLAGMTQSPLLPSLVEGGLVLLLRWACDDPLTSVMTPAIHALAALLCNPADEAALYRVFPWYQGHTTTALTPPATTQLMEKNSDDDDEDNKAEETDADVTKRDLIQGVVDRMVLLQRLTYVLESCQPPPPTVINILSILTRVARHSSHMAYELARNVRLMKLIFLHFLPTSWDNQGRETTAGSSVYGRPLGSAVRLVGAVCQAGRHMAASMVHGYHLTSVLTLYLSLSTQDLLLSAREADSVHRESLITWRILLAYGLAADIFLNIYPSLMDQLRGVVGRQTERQRHTDSGSDGGQRMERQREGSERDVLLVSALEGVLPVAATTAPKAAFNQGEGSQTAEGPVSVPVSWGQVEGVCPLVTQCTQHCLRHLTHTYTQQRSSLQLPAVCVNFLATFYSKWSAQASHSAVDMVHQAQTFAGADLAPFLQSWAFTSIVRQLGSSSNVLCSSSLSSSSSSESSKRREVIDCLPELGCDLDEGRVPVAGESSVVGFLLGVCRLTLSLCKVHRGLTQQTVGVILGHEDVRQYLRKVTSCAESHLDHNYFTRYETLLHYCLIKMALMLEAEARPPTLHQLSLDVMSRLQDGDEFLAHDLLTSVIFNADFIPEGREEELTAASMADLTISKTHILKSATQEEITTNHCQLLREGFRALAVIRGHYFRAFAHMEKRAAVSRCVFLQLPLDTGSLQCGSWEGCLMPRDWVFLPLVNLYNSFASVHSGSQRTVEVVSGPVVGSCLQWVLMLEMWRPRAMACISVTLKVSRLMCVFLGGDQLFLERWVSPYLASLFRLYTTPRHLSALDFQQNIPGISFYDLYTLLLDQYEAVSYGDAVFSSFVLLPMMQTHSVLLRRAVWQERSLMLRTLTLPLHELLIDIEHFLTPEETDPQLLQLYTTCLLAGTVRRCWSPLLFVVALHHVNRFLFHTPPTLQAPHIHTELRERLWERVLKSKDQGLKHTMVHYKQVDVQAEDCVLLYDSLPPHRQQTVDTHAARLTIQL